MLSFKKVVIIIIFLIVITALLIWLFIESSKPLPGEKIADLGRGHVQVGTQVDYNSNPPTSGKHYGEWVRAGVYETPRDDRNLVHSLEHGYVTLHYRCNPPVIPSDSEGSPANVGQNESGDSSPSGESDSPSAQNDNVVGNTKEECDQRKSELEEIYNKKGKRKLIVVPRPSLDTNFALTAWNYLDKFDPSASSGLTVSEMERVEKFIDAHLNMGPEKTME